MTRERFLILLTLLFMYGITFAQPANDDFCNAAELPINASCTSADWTLDGANTEEGEPIGSCFFPTTNPNRTIWFKFTAPPTGVIMATVNFPAYHSGSDLQMAMYELSGTADCIVDSLVQLRCNNAETSSGALELLPTIVQEVIPGQEYYVQVASEYVDEYEAGSFCIKIEQMYRAKNDDICDAIPLELDAAPISFTNVGATSSPEEASLAPPLNFSDFAGTSSWGSATITARTVWFTFVAPSSGVVDLDLSSLFPVGNFNSKISRSSQQKEARR